VWELKCLAQCNWIEPCARESCEQFGQNQEYYGRTVRCTCRVAVVQQQDISSAQISSQSCKYESRIVSHGIESTAGPADQLQVTGAQDGFEEWISQTRWSAEVPRTHTCYRCDHALCPINLPPHALWTQQREVIEVVLRVILNLMAAARDFARDLGMSRDALANAKKCRLAVKTIEQFEYLQGNERFRSVINRKCYLARGGGALRQAPLIGTQQCAAWPQSRQDQYQMIECEDGK
jgi:hypothetical protein